MCAKIQNNLKNIIGSLLFIAAAFVFIYTLKFTTAADIWYDEVFSVSFAKMSFSDIVSFTARDVHPPFYYFYLKVATGLITSIFGENAFFLSAKLASCLPWLGLFVLAVTCIRKRFSLFTAGLFMFLVSLMPQISVYYVEIRMYSLALFLITAHILVADRILNSEHSTMVQWLLFFILGIMTAYTQYYACIATIGIYLGCGILAFTKEGDKETGIIKGLAASAVLSVITYMPWLSVLKTQMDNISGKYWIQPLTLRSIPGCLKFITLPVVYAGKLPIISAALLIAAMAAIFVVLCIRAFRNKEFEPVWNFILMMMPVFVVVVSGFVLSVLGTPIFTYRYLIPALGGFWLFFARGLDRITETEHKFGKLFYFLLIPFILVGALNYKGFCDEEGKKLYEAGPAMEVVKSLPSDAVVITNFDHVTAIMGFYRPDCEVYLYHAETDKILPDMMESIRDDMQDEAISFLLEDGREVYFFGSFNTREDIVKDWESLGIKSTMEKSILIERYWIDVYKLEM